MKYPITGMIVMLLFVQCNNAVKKTKEVTTSQNNSYQFDLPKGWTSEHIAFPISFASSISYKGVEDLRFTPGWGNPATEEYWSYTFVWWLEGNPLITADTLQNNMRIYYTGLVSENVSTRRIPANKVIPVIAGFQKIATAPGDEETYKGTVSMLDYMVQQPMVLNSLVHKKKCSNANHTVVLFEMSPKAFDHAVWQDMNKLQLSFSCGK